MDTTVAGSGPEGEIARLAAALPAYEIGAVLGRGAFAAVYAGRHRRLDREVAIKRLSPELLREGDAHVRFAAEARLLASLDHPHVVRVHDYVEDEDVCALVMERLHGGTLADRMALGQLPLGRSCAVMLAALHGLEHAHRHGVLHRDVKPENLLFSTTDTLKVADFGIAKVVGAQGAQLTATAPAIGTPAYMAPEQVTRTVGRLSSATDVWAVGVVLYRLLAGDTPYPRGDIGEFLMRLITDDPRPLRSLAPDVPEELAEVVMHALQRNPADRYPTPGAFAAALEPVAERVVGLSTTGIPIHRTEPRPDDIVAPRLVETADASLSTTAAAGRAPAPPRRRAMIVGGVAAGVAGVAVAAVIAFSGGGDGNGGGTARRAALPPIPPGWPQVMSVGFPDQVDGPAGTARRIGPGGSAQEVFSGDPAGRTNWSRNTQYTPAAVIRGMQSHKLLPYLIFYVIPQLGEGDGEFATVRQLRRHLADPKLMALYWRNVKRFLQSVGSTKVPVAVSGDQRFWSYLEQELVFSDSQPDSVRVSVGASGVAELRGLPDDLLGFGEAWHRLRDRYAPKALLGYAVDDWASNVDISRDGPQRETAIGAARDVARFQLQVAANDYDFVALTINGDLAEEGQDPNPKNVYSTAEKERVVDFVRELARVARIPVVLEGVPLGNTVMKTITDKPFHWRDSWVQWLAGDDGFTGLTKLRDAGVIGVQFGVNSGPNETCPCDAAKDGVTNAGKRGRVSRSPDDDGGYFAERTAALRKAGGLSLR